jgi:chromosome segregation ATPase
MADDPKAGAATPAAVADPEQELADKKAELSKAKRQLDDLTKKTTGLEADIKGLEAGVSEITKALGTYDTDSKKMTADLTTQQAAINSKGTVVDPAVKDQKDKIDKAISDAEKKATDAAAAADKAETAVDQATTKYNDASADAQKKAQAYTDLKNAPKTAGDALKTLKGLNDDIAKAIQNNELAGAYYLLTKARTLAAAINIPSAAEYKKALQPALDASETAKTTLRDKKLALDDAKKSAADLRKTANTLSASQKADILKALKDQFGK